MSSYTRTVPAYFEDDAPPPAMPLLTCHTELLLAGFNHAPPTLFQDLPSQPPLSLRPTAINRTPLVVFPDPDFDTESPRTSRGPTQISRSSTPFSLPDNLQPPPSVTQRREVTFSLDHVLDLQEEEQLSSDTESDPVAQPPTIVLPTGAFAEHDGTIRKPDGEVGRPGRGGYTLQRVLEWHPQQFAQLQV